MRGLGIFVVMFGLACTAPIQHGLDESSANEVVTALERGGIGASKARDEASNETFVISVGKGDTVRALELLHSLGLPRGRRSGFGEVYKQPSLVPTPTEERARYVEALAGEIERTLETVDGVVSARVHLVLPETDPLAVDGKPRVAAQAAVLMKSRAGQMPLKEAEVQRLVAGSVPSLEPNAVAVVVTTVAEAVAPATAPMAVVGPLRVAAESRGILLSAILGALAIIVLLSGLLLVTARRLAAAQVARNGE